MSREILILGGSSSIARALAGVFADKGYSLYLAGRDIEDLERISSDLQIRHGANVQSAFFDAEDYGSHEQFLNEVLRKTGSIDGTVIAFGFLGDQNQAARDFGIAHKVINGNFTGAVSILTLLSAYFEQQGRGFIIGLSSVAGDRGRARNYSYGAAKGALSIYLQGLRARLFRSGVRVITVKLGFVDTAMTFSLPGLFWIASPEYVAQRILRVLDSSRDVVYLPWFWRYIMLVIRALPEFIFKRLTF